MSPVITIPDVLENTSPSSTGNDVALLPGPLSSALRPRAYRAETALDILAREYPDLHLQALGWLR